MKKYLILIICLLSFSVNVYAQDKIKDMNIDIFIDDYGNASIKETWQTSVSQSSNYTEWYKQYFNLGNSDITDLKVTINGEEYKTLNSWDINASFSEKAYKAGINYVNEGDEICWGMTKYGDNTYTIEYKISNFVNNVQDAQLVYWAIVPEQFDFPIDKVYVKIHSNHAYSDDLDVWGYGYKGYAYVYNGIIEMSTENNLAEDAYMVVLIEFPTGTFNTSSNIDKDFEYYERLAKEGSTPWDGKKSFMEKAKEIFSFIGTLFGTVFLLGYAANKAKTTGNAGTKTLTFKNVSKKLPKDSDINAFRDIPCNGELAKAYWLCSAFNIYKSKNDYLGCLILKWINQNKIEITKRQAGVFSKEDTVLLMKDNQIFDNQYEEQMYRFMKDASKDNVLEKDEFKKYCNKNYSSIFKWFDNVIDGKTDELAKRGELEEEDKQVLGLTTHKYGLTKSLRDEAIQLAGLKKFLNTFTNIKDKSAIEVKLLNQYLIYAQLFGIANKVAKEFKKLYPEVITDTSYDYVVFINDFSTTSVNAASSARSRAESYTAGGGGFSSFGGGGGSFGGGGGGGAR